MIFPSNPREYPRFIFLDTTSDPQTLFKPYQYIEDDSGNVYIDLVGLQMGSESEIKKTVPLADFIGGRFVPVLSVDRLRALTSQFQALDSNVFFGGSFPDNSPPPEPLINPPII